MEPVFNQALKAWHVGFVTDTQQSIKSYKHSHRGLPGCFVQHWCMQQRVLLIVNKLGQNKGEEIYSLTLFNRL